MTIPDSSLDVRRSLRVTWRGTVCALFDGSTVLLHGPWRDFEELAHAVRRVARKHVEVESAHKGQLQIRGEGTHTVLTVGRWTRPLPYADLAALAAAMLRAVRQAEAQENSVRARQAADGAILARAGLPFGLSSDPKVKDEIAKLAGTDSTLRKALPFVTARPIPDAPTVRHISPVATLHQLYVQHEQLRKQLYG